MFARLSNKVKINLTIQAICLCIGTYTHVDWVVHHGFLHPDTRYSIYSQLFWDSLTFLDPLAALLLFVSPRKGVWLTVAIIVTDVLHNGIVSLGFASKGLVAWMVDDFYFILQVIFCVFVLVSLRMNIAEINKKRKLKVAA